MKVKELRKLLQKLPGNMEIMVNTGLDTDENTPNGYGSIVLPVRKAKTKLQKQVEGFKRVQSRPHKDEKATLSLILE